MTEYRIGMDVGKGKDISIEERYMRPTAECPMGSYLRLVDGKPDIATGHYEQQYPGHPSLYWHGGAPFVIYDYIDVPWENT